MEEEWKDNFWGEDCQEKEADHNGDMVMLFFCCKFVGFEEFNSGVWGTHWIVMLMF